MQPNGLYNPDSNQPAEPQAQPDAGQPTDPAANQPVSAEVPAEQPVAEQPFDDEYEDEDVDTGAPIEPVSWTAHEYIHQEKGAMWFVLFAVVIVALIAISIFLMKSWSFAVLLGVIAVVVVVYSRRPPRELNYLLTDEGLQVDDKVHKFESFKSFGIIRDGDEFSVMLIPVQRFQPGVTVYFPEESGEAIVDVLGSRLPMKELKLDAVDRVVRLLRL